MSNPSLVLRGGSSGPTFEGSTPGHVLTVAADGKSITPAAAAAGNKVAVSVGDTTPDYLNQKLTSVQGTVLSIVNPGGNELISIGLSPNPSFLPETNAGNKTGAASVDVGSVDGCAQKITLTGNTSLTINSKQTGRSQWYQFKVVQDATGGRTLTIVGAKTPGTAGLSLSATPGAEDLVSVYYDGSALYAQVVGLAFG